MQSVYPIPLLVFALLGACLGSGDEKKVKNSLTGGSGDRTGMNLNVGKDKAKIGVQHDGGNPFFYVECSAGIDIGLGLQAGCERKWKPLFYACIAGGGVLAALLLSCCCCCCCCCAPCRRRQPVYIPQQLIVMAAPPQLPLAPIAAASTVNPHPSGEQPKM